MTTTDTRQTIMDIARGMVQARGYNALSFREIAKVVGVKSASIHYHFPTKGDLGAALAKRYTDDALTFFDDQRAHSTSLEDSFQLYTNIFRSALERDNRMCLCGIMSAEYDDLPPEVRVEVDRFTDVNIAWLSDMLTRKKSRATADAVQKQALAIFAAVEGAQLVARGRGDLALFDQTIEAYRQAGLIP